MAFAAFLIQWIGIGQQVFQGGKAAWDEIKTVLQAKGYAADTSAIDTAITEAEDVRAKEQGLADS